MPPLKVNFDCRHYLGDRPCAPHKSEGVHCDSCPHYDRVDSQVLVIKLAAPGDVLRTTSVLPALRDKYPQAYITWITEEESAPLLEHNPHVDRLIALNSTAVALVTACEFSLVLNLDTSLESCALAAAANARKKLGFSLNSSGQVTPANPQAGKWLEMSVFDDVKKQNSLSYQGHVYKIAELEGEILAPQLILTEEELGRASQLAELLKIADGEPVVGINTGCGQRWRLKKWTYEGYRLLAERLDEELGAQVLLLGGPLEAEQNRRLSKEVGRAIDTGQHELRNFCAVVNLCDVVVTGDTLALHIAVALGKKVVALFGPTSASEIELFGKGKKIVAPLDCTCCYRTDCDVVPNCMESISPEEVFSAVKELLEAE